VDREKDKCQEQVWQFISEASTKLVSALQTFGSSNLKPARVAKITLYAGNQE